MSKEPMKIEDVKAELEAILAQAEHLKRLITAHDLLVSENIALSGTIVAKSSMSGNLIAQKAKSPRNEQVSERDAAVREAIGRFGKRRFTCPDIVRATGLDSRRARRALDVMTEKGQIEIVEKGYKRKPTRYKVVQME